MLGFGFPLCCQLNKNIYMCQCQFSEQKVQEERFIRIVCLFVTFPDLLFSICIDLFFFLPLLLFFAIAIAIKIFYWEVIIFAHKLCKQNFYHRFFCFLFFSCFLSFRRKLGPTVSHRSQFIYAISY